LVEIVLIDGNSPFLVFLLNFEWYRIFGSAYFNPHITMHDFFGLIFSPQVLEFVLFLQQSCFIGLFVVYISQFMILINFTHIWYGMTNIRW